MRDAREDLLEVVGLLLDGQPADAAHTYRTVLSGDGRNRVAEMCCGLAEIVAGETPLQTISSRISNPAPQNSDEGAGTVADSADRVGLEGLISPARAVQIADDVHTAGVILERVKGGRWPVLSPGADRGTALELTRQAALTASDACEVYLRAVDLLTTVLDR